MKVDTTTATPHDKGRADAAQDLENKDLSCHAIAVDGATDVASPNPPLLACNSPLPDIRPAGEDVIRGVALFRCDQLAPV
jgi:hypothetical protein